ncbi:hypothetical protein Dimus_030612, partial [Dionaea muscipula]
INGLQRGLHAAAADGLNGWSTPCYNLLQLPPPIHAGLLLEAASAAVDASGLYMFMGYMIMLDLNGLEAAPLHELMGSV